MSRKTANSRIHFFKFHLLLLFENLYKYMDAVFKKEEGQSAYFHASPDF
jgi:hypothetical protein